MLQAKQNDTVKVHYTGKLDDGTVFDSSVGREPLEFTLGEGRVIPGFEDAVFGMETGDTKTVIIPAADAYGDYEAGLAQVVPHASFPPNIQPEVGQRLQVQNQAGQTMVVTITAIGDNGVTLDGNHPLAGKDLTFDIELVAIA